MTNVGDPNAPAGWYPDATTGRQRYWNGTAWTEQLSKRKLTDHVSFWLGCVAAFLILMFIIVGVANSGTSSASPHHKADAAAITPLPSATPTVAAPAPAPVTHSVMYSVWGNGSTTTDISYNDPSNGNIQQAQAAGAAIPWSKTLPFNPDNFNAFTIVAQDGNGTSITCMITVDGKVVSQETSTGEYAVVTCSK